ncbi:MAG: endonuclease/exonuclease/phosphatase family protein [Thiotrichales bacterium]
MPAVMSRLFLIAAVLAGAGALLGFFGALHWTLDLFAHFRVQYAAVLVPAALVFWRRRWLVSFLVVAAASNLWVLYPVVGGAGAVAGETTALRVATVNLNYRNRQDEAVVAFLRDAGADIVVLQEVTPAWEALLRGLTEQYPYAWFAPREDPFGIALLSRRPCADCRVMDFGVTPAIAGRFALAGREIEVVGIHPPPPMSAEWTAARDDLLMNVAGYLSPLERPAIVLGDLNATPWSAGYRAFIDASGLARGRGLHPTWPSFFGLPVIPIDHVLVSAPLSLSRVALGPEIGSDHYPLLADIVLR